MADRRGTAEAPGTRSLTDGLCRQLKSLLRGKLLFNEPMARHTSLKVGGPADCLAFPADRGDLLVLLSFLSSNRVPCMVMGGGYNMLVRDGGIRGVVVSLREMARLEVRSSGEVYAEAGVENRRLVQFAMDQGLGGLEFLVGIPGKLGGALAMNAGAAGQTISDGLENLETVRDGELVTSRKEELEFGYRFLKLTQGEMILAASFRLGVESRGMIEERMKAFLEQRRATQKVGFPNAGSFFRNPPEKAAWELIDEAGLRGYRIGGAQVSEVHTNFLINRGGAKAADFLKLAEHVKEEVKRKTGITLEEEVRIAGEE